MTHKLSAEEFRIATAQNWLVAQKELDDMMDGVGVEFMRVYLQGLERATIDFWAEVTEEEAREALQRLKDDVAFNRMMIKFVQKVVEFPAKEAVGVFLNSKHREWVRHTHQRYQGLKMYTGDKKGTVQPKLYGVPIVIDETVTEPRVE